MICNILELTSGARILLGKMPGDRIHVLPLEASKAASGSAQYRESSFEQIRDDQANHHCDGGSTEVVEHGFPPNGTDLFDVLHGDHSFHNGQENDRDDDEFQQINEDIAQGFQNVGGPVRALQRDQSHDNTCHHGDKDPDGQRKFTLFGFQSNSPLEY